MVGTTVFSERLGVISRKSCLTAGARKADKGLCELGNYRTMHMVEICNTVVTNGLLAVGLAVAVALVCTQIQRPSIRHLLWVLVLLRLIVPPIFAIDLSQQRDWLHQLVVERAAVQQAELRFSYRAQLNVIRKVATQHPGVLPMRTLFTDASEDDLSIVTTASPTASPFDFRNLARQIWFCLAVSLVGLWIAGSIACFAYQLVVVFRFSRRVRDHSYKSMIWQRRANKLANRMGLATSPQVRIVREAISPMLWGVGRRAQILLPDRLFDELDHQSQNGLICHELAHYQRGDHWVRLLESIAMLAFWWHPVFWWARHEIEKAEELCCDAIAVNQSFGNRRKYAEALLRAIDFVSGVTLPPAASGAVRNGLLRRRLELIMSKQHRRAAERKFSPGLLLLFAAILLPFPSLSNRLSASTPNGMSGKMAQIAAPSVFTPSRTPLVQNSADAALQNHDCVVETDECHRTTLKTRNGSCIDLGVGRVSVSTWSNSAGHIAIGTTDGTVELRSDKTGEQYMKFMCGHAAITCLMFSADDRHLGIADRDGELMLLDLSNGARLLRIRKQNARVIDLSFEADGTLRAVWSRGGILFEEALRDADGRLAP